MKGYPSPTIKEQNLSRALLHLLSATTDGTGIKRIDFIKDEKKETIIFNICKKKNSPVIQFSLDIYKPHKKPKRRAKQQRSRK